MQPQYIEGATGSVCVCVCVCVCRLVQGAGEMAEALGAEGAVQTTLDVLLNPGHTQVREDAC